MGKDNQKAKSEVPQAPAVPVIPPTDYLVGLRKTTKGYSVVSARIAGDEIISYEVDNAEEPMEFAARVMLQKIRQLMNAGGIP